MGSTSKYGRATINPSAPTALGICDGCGFLYNLHVLRFQFQWAGTGMIDKHLRKCPTCYDKPSEFLRAITLPPDPPPVVQPRPEPYLIDEVNEYWLKAFGMGVPMFGVKSSLVCLLSQVFAVTLSADFVAVGTLSAVLTLTPAPPPEDITTEGGAMIETEGGDSITTEG